MIGTLTPTRFLNLWRLDALRSIALRGRMLSIGALATHSAIRRSPLVRTRVPMLAAASSEVGGVQIQNRGTIGGNVANASPAGDTLPVLAAMDAVVVLKSATATTRVLFTEFYTGYRRSVLAADELIRSVVVPLPQRDELFATYKVSKRRDLDISSFAAAIWMHVEEGIIRAARIALGGVAPTIVRLLRTEAYLSEQRLCDSTLRAAGKVAREEITPISDVRCATSWATTP